MAGLHQGLNISRGKYGLPLLLWFRSQGSCRFFLLPMTNRETFRSRFSPPQAGTGTKQWGVGRWPNRHQWGFSKCSKDSTLKARNLHGKKARVAQGKKRLLTEVLGDREAKGSASI
jgi:hypothetical protein